MPIIVRPAAIASLVSVSFASATPCRHHELSAEPSPPLQRNSRLLPKDPWQNTLFSEN
jgi:hypothetical protein